MRPSAIYAPVLRNRVQWLRQRANQRLHSLDLDGTVRISAAFEGRADDEAVGGGGVLADRLRGDAAADEDGHVRTGEAFHRHDLVGLRLLAGAGAADDHAVG